MRHATKCSIALAGGLLALYAQQSSALILSLAPNSTVASPGDLISLDLLAGDLDVGGSDSIGVFDISLGYDPGALTFTDYSLDALLGNPALAEALDFSLGNLGSTVHVGELTLLLPAELDAIQPAAFRLATLNFSVGALMPGAETMVMIDPVSIVGDAFGSSLQLTGLGNATIRGAELPVGVPEPGTLWLMTLGAIGLTTFRRRTASR